MQPGPLLTERIWKFALAVTRRGSLSHEPIPLTVLMSQIDKFPPGAFFHHIGDVFDVDVLKTHLLAMMESGEQVLRPPWPGPDLEHGGGGWIWNVYSQEAQLARVRAVYLATMNAYRDLLDAWVPLLAQRLRTFVTLPARLVGDYQPGSRDRHRDWPVMNWFFDALPVGAASSVDIEVRDVSLELDEMRAMNERLRHARPDAAEWIGLSFRNEIAGVFQETPVTEMVRDWLRADLRRAKWA
jgi:hypothetical protein